jgi:hypothetical protein
MNESKSEENLLENPVFRYGISLVTAAIILVVAFVYFDGVARWLLLGLAIFEVIVLPRRLEKVAKADRRKQHESS